MSGFAAIIGPRGSQIDSGDLGKVAAAIAYCGPDRQNHWHDGNVGLAHALLRTTFEDEGDRQPLSFDGKVWLVGDIRVDDRGEFVRQLRAAGRDADAALPDSALVLHAYHAWGEACVQRLIGDFAFAIWDDRSNSLFCARDQFGAVPFHYASIGPVMTVANTVEALLALPGLDRSLNRATIGDYLLFGHSYDPAAGFFRNVHRLPPAHCLTWSEGASKVWRYWSPPDPEPRSMAESETEVVERFAHILGEAVKDRLRAPRVAISLSGGMDSTLVAAMAVRHAPAGVSIEAHSSGCDWFVPDTERNWAYQCARHLGIAFHANSVEPTLIDPVDGVHWRDAPEPRFWMQRLTNEGLFRRVVKNDARVLLTGHGGDALVGAGFHEWGELLAHRDFTRLIPQLWRYFRHFKRRPPLRGAWNRRTRARSSSPWPVTLDPAFVEELDLERRWDAVNVTRLAGDPRHSLVDDAFWAELLSGLHPESLRLPLKVRSPLIDVRLINEVMRLPATPWQFDKTILRRVGAELLPESILARRKTAYGYNLYCEAARQGHAPWLNAVAGAPELEGLVDGAQVDKAVAEIETLDPNAYFRRIGYPAGLAMWIRRQRD